MNPFEAYTTYVALKQHFTSSYDYFKYQGKIKATVQSFENRRDKYFFHKLSKKDNLEKFLAANIFMDDKIWVGNLFDEKCQEIFDDFEKRQLSLTYTFKEEIKQIDDLNAWLFTNGEYPKLYSEHKKGRISIETLIIIDRITNCFDYWLKHVEDTVLFPSHLNRIRKYSGFLKYDHTKYTEILKKHFRNHNVQGE